MCRVLTVGLHRAIHPHFRQGPCGSRPGPRWRGKVGGGSREGFYEVLHKETYPKHSQIRPKSAPKIGRYQRKSMEIRLGGSLLMIASQRPYCRSDGPRGGAPQDVFPCVPFGPVFGGRFQTPSHYTQTARTGRSNQVTSLWASTPKSMKISQKVGFKAVLKS
jgi:hypothetical protein